MINPLLLPCEPSSCTPAGLQIHEISLDPRSLQGRCRIWQRDVQPHIDAEEDRPDRGWQWRRIIPILTLVGGSVRKGRLFQLTVGPSHRPAAMLALLEEERWPNDTRRTATFLWFLSTAPALCLRDSHTKGCTPKLVGRAAFQVALTVALSGAAEGRLWLHAAPSGGERLLRWYQDLGMTIIDRKAVPNLPGFHDAKLSPRRNDGRYLCIDTEKTLDLHARYAERLGLT